MKQGLKKYLYLALASIIMIFALVISSSVIVYFKTGADQSQSRFSRSPYIIDDLTEVYWYDEEDQEVWTDFIRDDVAKSYLQCWKTLNDAYWTLDWSKMDRFFDEALIDRLQDSSEDEEGKLKRVCLQHHLELQHLSLDFSVVVFEDRNIPLIQELELADGTILSTTTYLDLQVKMVLQDGQWKVYNWHTIGQRNDMKRETRDSSYHDNMSKILDIKGVNYYSQHSPWKEFWIEYDSTVIHQDLSKIRDLGFNSIRVFIPLLDFGRNDINLDNVKKLDHMLNTADSLGLMIVPTLFDFPIGYDLWTYPSYYRQLKFLVNRYIDHPALLAWNLKNEPDIDFIYHNEDVVLSWLQSFIALYYQLDNKHPLTIGWADGKHASLFADQLDYISFHHYTELDELKEHIKSLSQFDKNLVIEEFGFPSGNNPVRLFLNTQSKQADYVTDVVQFAKENNIGWMVWTLYDYPQAPSSVFGWKPWIRKDQRHFGLIGLDGSFKKVVPRLQPFLEN